MSLDASHAAAVRESWSRCRLAGLDSEYVPPLRYISPGGIGSPSASLIAETLARAEGLYRSLAGQAALMLLTDGELRLVSCLGAPALRLQAAALGATPGAEWSEEVRGTNALALALRQGGPMTVCGDEHYLERLRTWSGAALPLASNAGVLGLYVHGASVHESALSLLDTCAGPLAHTLGALEEPQAAPATLPLEGLARGDRRVALAVARAKRILGRDIPLLIQGETGTGKEVFARAFHHSGPRASGPFIAVNCAAIPAPLIEAELFGHVEGAFTGARREGSPGKLRLADGGTLFLDEIGDMPLKLQSVLLRVMETRRVSALGESEEHEIDLALLCATHQPLRELVERGAFRADLYFRLSGMTIELPPLRSREDFAAMVQDILDEESPLRPLRASAAALALLAARPWPGNLRELRNVLRLAVALAGEDGELQASHLEDAGGTAADAGRRLGGSLREVEMEWVKQAVLRHGGNISAAARELRITRTTLYRRLRGE